MAIKNYVQPSNFLNVVYEFGENYLASRVISFMNVWLALPNIMRYILGLVFPCNGCFGKIIHVHGLGMSGNT
jgi:hypothetical protein